MRRREYDGYFQKVCYILGGIISAFYIFGANFSFYDDSLGGEKFNIYNSSLWAMVGILSVGAFTAIHLIATFTRNRRPDKLDTALFAASFIPAAAVCVGVFFTELGSDAPTGNGFGNSVGLVLTVVMFLSMLYPYMVYEDYKQKRAFFLRLTEEDSEDGRREERREDGGGEESLAEETREETSSESVADEDDPYNPNYNPYGRR